MPAENNLLEVIEEKRNVSTYAKTSQITITPAAITGIIAAFGVAGLFFFIGLSPDHYVEGPGDGMISAAVVHSAGATITPSVSHDR